MLLAVRISSYGCTSEVWRALKKLELLSAIAGSGHSSEQSTVHFSSKVSPTLFRTDLRITDHRGQIFFPPLKTANAPFRSKLESNGLQVYHNRNFSERIFTTPVMFKATSKFFSSLGCSDYKN